MVGGSRIDLGRQGDLIRELGRYLEAMKLHDPHFADAEGDSALRAYWRLVKSTFPPDPSGPDGSETTTRLIAREEGPDILVGRTPVIVGRHPRCDVRLDSIRVSRLHCLLAEDDGVVVVRDLGSVNGIRINGRRVELGRLRFGDELSIAHLRYRVGHTRARFG